MEIDETGTWWRRTKRWQDFSAVLNNAIWPSSELLAISQPSSSPSLLLLLLIARAVFNFKLYKLLSSSPYFLISSSSSLDPYWPSSTSPDVWQRCATTWERLTVWNTRSLPPIILTFTSANHLSRWAFLPLRIILHVKFQEFDSSEVNLDQIYESLDKQIDDDVLKPRKTGKKATTKMRRKKEEEEMEVKEEEEEDGVADVKSEPPWMKNPKQTFQSFI